MRDKRDNPEYMMLSAWYLFATGKMEFVSRSQNEDRKLLKLTKEPDKQREIRARMMKRRRGPYGLRALNGMIHRFYRYCEENGI